MRVVVVTQGKFASGAEVITKELYSSIKENVTIITGSRPIYNYFNKNNFTVDKVIGLQPLKLSKFKISRFINIIKAFYSIRKKIKKIRPNYIHVNNIQSLLYAYVSTCNLKVPIILQVHDYYSKSKLISRFARILKGKPKYIVAVSNSVRQDLIKLGFSSSKIKTIHNGISFKKEVHREYEQNSKITVGFVATISEWKGLHILIEAAKILDEKGFRINYSIVGPFMDESYEQKIKEMASKISISKLTFYGQCDNVRDMMENFDILVHCSISKDPFPTVILEGLFSKCAVIGSNCGGVPEILTNGETGLLHITGSPSSLADAIEKLVVNSKMRKQISINGYKRAKNYLNIVRFRKEFFEVVNHQ